MASYRGFAARWGGEIQNSVNLEHRQQKTILKGFERRWPVVTSGVIVTIPIDPRIELASIYLSMFYSI